MSVEQVYVHFNRYKCFIIKFLSFFQQDAGRMPRQRGPGPQGGAVPQERSDVRDHPDVEPPQLQRPVRLHAANAAHAGLPDSRRQRIDGGPERIESGGVG